MRAVRLFFTTAEVLLICPAVLFMTALFMRNVTPQEYEPAHTAQQIVGWYAARPGIGLWLLLIALPLTVLATGGATVWHRWREEAELRNAARDVFKSVRSHLSTLLTAAATLVAAGILAIVALHVLTD